MRCSRVQQLLPAYFDGDLSSGLSRQVSDHLDACQHCQQQQEAQHRAHRALDSGRHSLSIDLWADFSRRLQAEAPPRPSPWRHLWQPGLAAVAATIVVSLVARSAPPPPVSLALVPPARAMELAERVKAPVPEMSAAGTASARHLPRLTVGSSPRAERRPGPQLASVDQREAVAPVAAHRAVRTGRSHLLRDRSRPSSLGVVKERPGVSSEKKPRTGSLRLASAVAPVLPPVSDDRLPAPMTVASVPAASNPLDVAEALVAVQQDAANDQMRSELLLMAREVARVGGEAPPAAAAPDPTGT